MNTGDGPGAYRDERSSLAAENARLKAEVTSLRGARRSRLQRVALTATVLVADAWVFTLVVPRVNAPRDADVWLGWALAALMIVTNIVVAQRVLRSRG